MPDDASRLDMDDADNATVEAIGRKHVFIGSVISLATMLLFWAFRSILPAQVPLQFRIDGSVGNHVSRDVFVFLVPVMLAAANLLASRQLIGIGGFKPALGRRNFSVGKYYIVPALTWALSVIILVLALRLA